MTDKQKQYLIIGSVILAGLFLLFNLQKSKPVSPIVETTGRNDSVGFGGINVPELAFPEFGVTPNDFAINRREIQPGNNPPIPYIQPQGNNCCDKCAQANPLPYSSGFLANTVSTAMGSNVNSEILALFNSNISGNFFSGGSNRGVF